MAYHESHIEYYKGFQIVWYMASTSKYYRVSRNGELFSSMGFISAKGARNAIDAYHRSGATQFLNT